MGTARNAFNATLLSMAVLALIDTPQVATVGDSISNYLNATLSLSGATMSRDVNGKVTVVHTGLAPAGDKKVYLVNLLPASLMVIGDGHYVDANTYEIQTSITGFPLLSTDITINPGGLSSVMSLMDQMSGRGLFFHLQSKASGGICFKGNFGKQGDTSEQILEACTKAANAVAPGHFVQLMDGINSITPKGPDSVAATVAARKANIDAITALGRRVIVCRIKPVDALFASSAAINANVQLVNTQVTAYCDGTTKIDVDTFGSTWNGSTGASTGTTIPGDYLHPTWLGSKLDGDNVWPTFSALCVFHDLLPTAYNSVCPVPFATHQRVPGPYTAAPGWTTSTTGFLGGGSGVRPTAPVAWNCGLFSGTPTMVMSVVDPGDGKGQAVQVLATGNAANDKGYILLDGNSGVTFASLGLVAGDRFQLSCKVTWANYVASNCQLLQLRVTGGVLANGLAGMLANPQNESAVTFEGDAGFKVYVSGVMTVPPGITGASGVTAALYVGFSAASGSPLNVQISRAGWQKVDPTGPV